MIMKSISSCLSLLLISTLGHAAVPGVTPGEFSVDASGSANYQIPIAVPPGTAGMQPSLSLSYNSQSGNGVLGVGWTLGGLSVITRCPAVKAIDGVIDGIDFDSNDRFCIDGQRLIQITGAAGQYGDDGIEYRTELDGFTRVISYGFSSNGPDYFKVWTKSGQILEYGNTADSRIEAQGKTAIRLWAANKIADKVGNYLTVTYNEDATNGSYTPARIDYTGNDSAALAPYDSVQFSYETRTDIPPLYFAGSLVKNTQRLTNIKTYTGTTLVRDYQLSYDNNGAANRSRLAQVQECDGAGSCFNPTSIAWNNISNNAALLEPPITFTNNSMAGYESLFADFNGDGVSDILLDSKLSESDSRSGGYRYIYLSKRDGTFNPAITFTNNSMAGYESYPGDFNGDGLTDIMLDYKMSPFDMRSGGYRYIYLNKGDGTFNPAITFTNNSMAGYEPYLVDFNGDGLPDIMLDYKFSGSDMRSAGHRYIYLGKGDGTFNTAIQFTYNSMAGYVSYPGDFNGDGLSDIMLDYKFSGSDMRSAGHRYIYLGKGDGTFNTAIQFTYNSMAGYQPYLVDLNADGLTDIFLDYKISSTDMRSGGHRFIYQSNGDGTFTSLGFFQAQNDPYLAGYEPGFSDFNGDGSTDIMLDYIFSGSDMRSAGYRYIFSNKNQNFDLINTVTDSLNTQTAITYTPITNNNIYTKGTTATYPEVDIQAPVYVVSSVKVDDGLGGQRETTYRYGGAKSSYERGFLGFASMSATDASTGITTTTSYNQTYPYIGLVNHTEQIWDAGTPGVTSDDVLLGEVETTFTNNQTHTGIEVAPSHPGVLFPYAALVTKKDYELGVTP